MYLVQLGELDSLLWGAAAPDGGDVQHPVAKLNKGSSVGGQEYKVTMQGEKNTSSQGNGCSVGHAVPAGTGNRKGAMPTHRYFMPGKDQASAALISVSKGLIVL